MSAPLSGLKILDFSALLPGPYATMMLADLGADVLRIEAPNRADMTRLLPPHDADGTSAGHAYLNRNKRSLGLNLKVEGAGEVVRRLVVEQGYDVIVEQSRPGVMARLGVGYDAIREICPHVIYCSLTGYGQTGPLRDRAGHDLNYLALSGMLSLHGRAGTGAPAPLPTQVADIGAGSLHLVAGLLSAVIRRLTTGEGGWVDVAMLDGVLAWNGMAAATAIVGGASPEPEGTVLNGGSFYDLYETHDRRLLSVGSLEPKFWAAFCGEIGRFSPPSALHATPERKAELRDMIRSKTLAEWTAIFAELDACVEPVLTTREALEQPQTRARDMVVDVPTPHGSQPQVGLPIKLSGHAPEYRHAGTALGAHTEAVLKELAYTETEIVRMRKAGVIA